MKVIIVALVGLLGVGGVTFGVTRGRKVPGPALRQVQKVDDKKISIYYSPKLVFQKSQVPGELGPVIRYRFAKGDGSKSGFPSCYTTDGKLTVLRTEAVVRVDLPAGVSPVLIKDPKPDLKVRPLEIHIPAAYRAASFAEQDGQYADVKVFPK